MLFYPICIIFNRGIYLVYLDRVEIIGYYVTMIVLQTIETLTDFNDSPPHDKHRFNAETLAGMREVDDMLAGRTPEKWYGSIAEMLEDGDADD